VAKQKFPVHEDFAHYPAFPFPFNGVVTKLLNGFLHVDTFFRQRDVKAKAKKHLVTSSDGAQIPVFQFNPDQPSDGKRPAFIYFHGGAFVLTYASTHVEAMDFYANEVGCSVFMVDYRLAPAHPFPKGFNDCYDTLKWLKDNADSLGVDAEKIVVGGDSAGGALAAGVAQKALDETNKGDEKVEGIVGQLLIYPVIDRSCSTRSAKEYEKAPMFDAVANRNMWKLYLRDCVHTEVPAYASPGDRSDLKGLPKAYVENAEFDPLCDEARVYAERLQEAGVETELVETKGTVHGYDTVPESEITQDSLKRRLDFLKAVFA